MKAVQLKENVYWVGAVDWDLRNFHGYMTQKGSTYNAYLIIDEKITLIDTVKNKNFSEMISRISSVINPADIDIVISNHVEMDHSGALPELMKLIPHAEIITSKNGEQGLRAHYRSDWNFRVMKSGDTINTGKYNIRFFPTPMVHWPDNMFAYLEEEALLFSNDGFGQHLATSERFDDEYYSDIVMEEARKYYANIVLPYSAQVSKALQDVSSLKIGMIAPSHGVIWREGVESIVKEYLKWSGSHTDKKALVIYDTMWKSTEIIAEKIASCFEHKGYRIRLLNLQNNHISDIMTEILEAEYICVGSPTLNNNMMPSVAAFLTYLKGLAPAGRKALAFGSYGWGGQSIKQVHELLESCRFDMLEPVSFKYIPDKEGLDMLFSRLTGEID